jgi:hypothetical protein
MQKIRIIGFFFENRLHLQLEVEKQFYIFIYVQIKHQYIIYFMYLTVYPKGQADLDNQHPDKWSSTAQCLRGNSDCRVARTILGEL